MRYPRSKLPAPRADMAVVPLTLPVSYSLGHIRVRPVPVARRHFRALVRALPTGTRYAPDERSFGIFGRDLPLARAHWPL